MTRSTIGNRTRLPRSAAARGSRGLIPIPVSPSIVSGRVVATVMCPEPSSSGYCRYQKNPSTSSISTSSSESAVWEAGSQFTNRLPRSIRPSAKSRKNDSRTAAVHTGSIVNRVRASSHEAPISLSCARMTDSYSSFQS